MIETKFQRLTLHFRAMAPLWNETGSWKSNMANAKQDVSTTRPPDLLDTKFQGHTRIFGARHVGEGNADSEK